MIGPYSIQRIVLCSADASPRSQRRRPCKAGSFYPGAKWVGAMRNAANRLGCNLVILTTAHGMVNPEDEIGPYDLHIRGHEEEVRAIWSRTIPLVLGQNRFDILVLYLGGCPRYPALEIISKILHEMHISLITFGKPNMFDIDKVDNLVRVLVTGTSLDELKSIMGYPERLGFFPIDN
jgi:hypothetical protein